MKRAFIILLMLLLASPSVWACSYGPKMMTLSETSNEDAGRMLSDVPNTNGKGFATGNAKTQVKRGGPSTTKSGFGLSNLKLDAGFNYTEFSDRSINVQGDVEDYNIILSGDLNEKISFTLGYNHNRLDTDEGPEIVIESEGINFSLHYAITEHYGVGIMSSYSWVDYENSRNSNSYSWTTGAFFTTRHDLDYFVLSTVTTLAHTDFDVDHDTFWQVLVDVSRQWNDYFGTFAYIAYTDSLRTNGRSSADNSYYNYGLGFDIYATDQLTFSFSYDSTEGFEKYNDQTFSFNVGYAF